MTLNDQTSTGAAPAKIRRDGVSSAILRRLGERMERGRLRLVTPAGETYEIKAPRSGPEAVVHLARWRAARRLAFGGDTALAEAYIDGDWSSPDLTAVLLLGAANIEALDPMLSGSRLAQGFRRLRHLTRRNSRAGSRRNIAFHYDLGNEFYRLWLDESMTYSSALFAREEMTLEEAQGAKLDEIVARLELSGGERVLEIGSGWGELAARMARKGAQVTTLTLSREQRDHVAERMRREGLSDRVEVRLQDYRDVTGRFDRIVSIEMLEAVGEAYWPAYFGKLSACLSPGGSALLQVITIREDRFEAYRKGSDFIQRHVFPGGMLPSKTVLAAVAGEAGLEAGPSLCFGESYRRTLAEWHRRFQVATPEIVRMGFDPAFRRLWEYYLSYCEAGFATGMIDVGLYGFRARRTAGT